MNILFLCDEYPPCRHGGIGTVTSVLARELVKQGHMVVVCGFYPFYRKAKKFETDEGVIVFRYFYGNRLILKLSKHAIAGKIINVRYKFQKYIRNIRKLIRNYQIEIMEMPDYSEIFRYTGPKFVSYPDFGIPKIVKIHGGDSFFNFIRSGIVNRNFTYLKERKLIYDADYLIAISGFSGSVLRKVFSYNRKMTVIYNGIDISTSDFYTEDTEKKTVVFAGTITEKKGIFSLVKAWPDVITQVPDANLYIYGKGSNRTMNYLDNLINSNIRDSIHIMGFIKMERLESVYLSASCSVFPSFAESFGMAPLEAMVVGCPTIFTRRTSGPELIDHGEDGLLVDPENLKDISESIVYMLTNREKALELGIKGAKKVRSHFNISLIAVQHLKLYESMIKMKKGT